MRVKIERKNKNINISDLFAHTFTPKKASKRTDTQPILDCMALKKEHLVQRSQHKDLDFYTYSTYVVCQSYRLPIFNQPTNS